MILDQPTNRESDDARSLKVNGNFHHHLNNHHVHAIVVMLGFIIAQFFLMSFIVDASELTIQALLNCTNKIRVDYNVQNSLALNDQLNQAAGNKLKDMAQYQYWAHQNPVTGAQPWDFIDGAGYHYDTAGENLAYGFTDSQKICDAWQNSPKHLANIINPTFQDVGFAINKADLHTSSKGILVVQMFGSKNGVLHASAPSQTQQLLQNVDTITPENAAQVKGANTQNDSVYAPSSFLKNILPYVTGFFFFCSLAATVGVFNFKNNPKRVKMLKRAAVVLFVFSLLLLFYFFLTPTL